MSPIKMLMEAALDRAYFESLQRRAFSKLRKDEHLFLTLSGENSQFVRINGAKIRQVGTVEDCVLELALVIEEKPGVLKKAIRSITLSGISYTDQEELDQAVLALQAEVPQLPQDPYAQLPQGGGSSSSEKKGNLLPIELAPRELLEPIGGVDLAGIYASGPVVRAMANSAGLSHWFKTEVFSLDYSLYTPSQRAVKGTFAGQNWDKQAYLADIHSAQNKLKLLEKPAKRVDRGAYRTYLEPAAVSDLVAMLSWGGVSEASIRQGDSPLRKIRQGEASFSERFTLSEDFTSGATPRFNSEGELAPERLAVFENGKLRNTLVSSRTAKEYGVVSNGASGSERLRSAVLAPGDLEQARAAERLGTGLYLSNLHYLNWSDQPAGRITGMTRYACFWVEGGKIVAPIENLRFDDSLFNLFGGSLEALTRESSYLPEVGTYQMREVGGMRVPGMLLSEMKFTL